MGKDQRDRTRVLPRNIKAALTPRGLAHWIMGDGYYNKSSRNIVLCTDNFTYLEVEKLQNILNEKFNIGSSIHNKTCTPSGRHCWRISINRYSVQTLIDLSKPYMIPEMYYKLGIYN